MDIKELQNLELPSSISKDGKEYKKRVLEADGLAVIEYSIEAVMMRHLLRPGVISQKRVNENLLFEGKGKTLEEAEKSAKKKYKAFKEQEKKESKAAATPA